MLVRFQTVGIVLLALGLCLFGPPAVAQTERIELKPTKEPAAKEKPARERSVGAAINWIARHQNPDGSWSVHAFNKKCKDATCDGPGTIKADSAATGLALLTFLAAGQTHQTRGPYKSNIHQGIYWLMKNQKANGDLSAGSNAMMYSHAIASWTLCEAYGLTNDRAIGTAAQKAIGFIEIAQHPTDGGWRYQPGQEGDTSVTGWHVIALDAARCARLSVSEKTLDLAKTYLGRVSSGQHNGLCAYRPGTQATPSMTASGLTCRLCLNDARNAGANDEAASYILDRLPDAKNRQVYYWHYATRGLHRRAKHSDEAAKQWRQWDDTLLALLVDTQVKKGCAVGSWSPTQPVRDSWSEPGGRMIITALSTLSLETNLERPVGRKTPEPSK